MRTRRHRQWAACICLILISSGCREPLRQSTLEAQLAAHVAKEMTFYEAANAGARITNSLELFNYSTGTNSVMGYPYRLEQAFSKFPKHAGFTKSIYEKYIFPPPGLKPRTAGTEIVCLNAAPFPDGQQKLVRTVVLKTAANSAGYFVHALSEKTVQQIFSEAGVAIPNQTTLPPAPLRTSTVSDVPEPLIGRTHRYFRDVAHDLGIGTGSWWLVLLAYVAGFILLALIVSLFVWRRSRQ